MRKTLLRYISCLSLALGLAAPAALQAAAHAALATAERIVPRPDLLQAPAAAVLPAARVVGRLVQNQLKHREIPDFLLCSIVFHAMSAGFLQLLSQGVQDSEQQIKASACDPSNAVTCKKVLAKQSNATAQLKNAVRAAAYGTASTLFVQALAERLFRQQHLKALKLPGLIPGLFSAYALWKQQSVFSLATEAELSVFDDNDKIDRDHTVLAYYWTFALAFNIWNSVSWSLIYCLFALHPHYR